MNKVYFYHFNILTKKYKIEEFEILNVLADGKRVHISTKRNNKIFKVYKWVKDLESIEVERNGINISCCSYYNDKLGEFKLKCIPHVLDYKRKCEESIVLMQKAINDCNESLEILKK